MKGFVIRLLLFFILFVFIKLGVNSLAPYYWGNPWYVPKVRYLEKHKEHLPNVFFFGSSRVYRQINPAVFDSLYGQFTSEKVHSFNFGTPATFCPQSYYLYEEFLESKLSKNTELVFMELTTLDAIPDDLLHQERTRYWMNLSDLGFTFKSYYHRPNMSLYNKMEGFNSYLISYLDNLVSVGYFGKSYLKGRDARGFYNGPKQDGFFPLEYDLVTSHNKNHIRDMKARINTLHENPQELEARVQKSLKNEKSDVPEFDQELLKRLNALIERSKKQGIELVFILSPRNVDTETYNIATQIPQEHLLDFSSASRFPELYSLENSFDVGHLNDQGTKIYTQILVNEYLSRRNK